MIQIRLPDGKCLKNKFNTSENLSNVADFVVKNSDLKDGEFSFVSTYPRKEYQNDQFSNLAVKDFANSTLSVLKSSQKGKMTKGKSKIFGTVIHINSEKEFDELLKKNSTNLIVVDFFATWCGPCQMLVEPYKKLATRYKTTCFAKIDADNKMLKSVCMKYQIKVLPTIVFIKNSKIVDRVEGADITFIEKSVKKNM